ncbi:hypothetical protein LCGC14_2709780 [marine sediment metagenome]|uniref:Prepilin-type N-terminal cleavage/methylation domain-containing protein n=1 Tax=marine sediment metagenome TaxID=412755 RepID=A0A0F8ZD69_9ZZZZ
MRSRKALPRHSGQAFTLIELLVVIAIIALLVSILLPSLQQAKNLAKAVICKTRIKGLGTAIMLYQEGCGGWVPGTYPYGSVEDSGGSGITWPTWPHVMIALSQKAWENDPDYRPSGDVWVPDASYIDEPDMLYCPMDTTEFTQWAQRVNGSYGINTAMGNSPVGPAAHADFYNIQLTKRPDQMYLLFCNLNDGGGFYHDQSYAIVHPYSYFLANAARAWTPALRHGTSLDSTHMLDHSGAVSELHWKNIRTYKDSEVEVGDDLRIRGPWLNGLGLTEYHDVPDFEYDTIMSLPGN